MTDEEWAAIERPYRLAIQERYTMLNADTARPTIEPTDGIEEVKHYLVQRVKHLNLAIVRYSNNRRGRDYAIAKERRSEILGLLMMLDPDYARNNAALQQAE